MRGTWTVLRSEAYRLSRTRSIWTSYLALGALAYLAGVLTEVPNGVEEGAGWSAFGGGLQGGLVLGVFGLAFLSARSLAGDHRSWLLRLSVTRAASRMDLAWGRVLIGVPLLAGVVAVSLAGATLAGLAVGDFGDIVIDSNPLIFADELVVEGRRAVLGVLLPMFGVWCLGLLISAASPGSTPAVAMTLVLLLLLDLFQPALGSDPWLFTTFVPSLTGDVLTAEFALLGQGDMTRWMLAEDFQRSWRLPVPQVLLLTAATGLILRRRTL